VSWSVIDRTGRPKAAYATVQRSYQPLLIAARFPWTNYAAGEILPLEFWIVNDTPVAYPGCRAEAHLDGRPIWSVADIHVRPGAATRLAHVEIALDGPPARLELALHSADGVKLADNDYDLGIPHPRSAPPKLAATLYRQGMRLIGG
jgi:hypothetical protein